MKWFSFRSDWKQAESLSFYNTLSKSKEVFSLPPQAKQARMYTCGPTVYDRAHIGNLLGPVISDVVRRSLEFNGYQVKQVMNFTDFGHLVSDADDGEDKMTKGMRREGLELTMENMRTFATKYIDMYLKDITALGVATDKIQFARASDYVPAQIAMARTLEEKGYAYETSDGVYFDTARFPRYGELGNLDLSHQKDGARVAINPEKHNPSDFALWKKNAELGWDSSWGKGFPGWHIECSAMNHSLLGKQIDIHMGGIDLAPIHHNNEIAQSEAATGKHPFARFWIHWGHVQMNSQRLAKSAGNVAYVSDVTERGLHPIALRYWLLTSHYRAPANFTWEALEAAQKAFLRLRKFVDTTAETTPEVPAMWKKTITDRLNDDLDTPGAIAALWEMSKDASMTPPQVKAAILYADSVLGLGFDREDALARKLYSKEAGAEVAAEKIPKTIATLLAKREAARAEKDWAKADELRDKLTKKGYKIVDGPEGAKLIKMQ